MRVSRTVALLSIAFFLFALSAASARANDSAVEGAGGTVRRMGGEHKSVRMVRETVRMDLYPGYYETVADFTFTNDGRALTVKMGFPESGSGDVNGAMLRRQRTGGFLSFSTSLDGQVVAARRTSTNLDEGEGYQAYWVKQVPFQAGQTRRVQVRYRSTYGEIASPSLRRWVSYDFTGGNWRGKVAESTLIVTLREPGSFLVAPELALGETRTLPAGWMIQKGATFSHTFRDWQAEGSFLLWLGKAPPGWLAGPDESINNRNNLRGKDHTVTVRVPGKVTDALLGYEFLPSAMQANGITWLRLDRASWTLEPVLKAQDAAFVASYAMPTYNARTRQATLPLGKQRFIFTVGQAAMTVNGKTVVLPAAPRRLRSRGTEQLEMYVPLMPLLKVLGGTATINPDNHTLILRPKKGAKG